MCGICGIINLDKSPVQSSDLQTMVDKMKHRGPDDEGIFTSGNTGFGHVRLSIIDLSKDGHQPFICSDDRFVLVYNGELYNYLELKKQLSTHFKFITKTDTEVVLNAYKFWGEKCLEHFNGMFAFAIYDKNTNDVFIARDRFGIKPLYFFQLNNKFVFASDIAPLLELMPSCEPEGKIVYDYLVFDRVQHTQFTFFKNLKKLQHGHTLKISGSGIEERQWYNLSENIGQPFSSPEEYLDELKNAIKLQLRSDVPVGASLSGGLDSSSIVSTCLKYFPDIPIRTYSSVFEPGTYGDESEYINMYKGKVSEMYFARPDANTLFQDLNIFVKALGEPMPGTSEYAEFKVMQSVARSSTVILSGQGADEALGGYAYFFGVYFKELIHQLKFPSLIQEAVYYCYNHRSFYGLQALLFFMLPPNLQSKLSMNSKGYINQGFYSQHLIPDKFVKELYGASTLKESFLNHFKYKFEHNLLWGDKSSMWFSLEMRFPFLDHNIVEKTLAMKSNQIIHKGTTKKILRESMLGVLSEKIRNRHSKLGFSTPEDEWMRDPVFKNLIVDIIRSQKFRQRPYFNNKIEQLYNNHCDGNISIGKELWKIINLELWHREFIDK